MRRVSANYIVPVSSLPLKNGIVECDDSGIIISVTDTGGNLKETSKLEFYNGILVPGFISPYCRIEPFIFRKDIKDHEQLEEFICNESPEAQNDQDIHSRFSELEKILRNTGICGLGSVTSHDHFFLNKSAGKLIYHNFIEIYQQEGKESFELFNKAVEDIMTGWNEYSLRCSLVPFNLCKNEDISNLIAGFASNHKNPVILKCPDKYASSESMLIEFSKSLARITGKSGDTALINFNNPIIIPVHDLAEPITKSKADIYYLLPAEDLQMTGLTFRQRKSQDVNYNHILFSSYGLGFHTNYPIISELITLQFRIPWLSIGELIQLCTINPALALKMDHSLGSFEPGKAPGINLITNIDFNEMKLTEKSELKVII